MFAAVAHAEDVRLALPAVAARHAGRLSVGAAVLGLDLDPAWQFVGPEGRLTLVNHTGVDLHRCTVLVEIRGQGDPAQAFRYVPLWRAGEARYARYSPGEEHEGRAIGRRTPKGIGVVVASLWADELSQEGIRRDYGDAERDADVARYCREVRVELTTAARRGPAGHVPSPGRVDAES